MKATLLFATLTMVLAAPRTFATAELEALRERCARQEQEIRKLEDQILKTQPARASTAPAAKSVATAGTYTVRSGDSLERIARRNGCSANSLVKANGLGNSSVIHPGQKLKIPGKGAIAQTSTPAPAPAASHTATAAPLKSSVSSHKISQGETFASISRKHRVPLASLIAANPEVKPTALRPGQVIRLSADSPASKPAPSLAAKAPASRPEKLASAPLHPSPQSTPTTIPISTRETTIARTPAPAVSTPVSAPSSPAAEVAASTPPTASPPQGTSLSPNPEKKIRSVTIEGEMSYGEFAAKHGTDTERLNDLNGLDLTHATVLAKGSELYVPAQP